MFLTVGNADLILLQRAALTDFDRFKLRKARQRRNKIRTQVFYTMRKAAKRDGTIFGKKKMAKGGDKPKPKKEGKTAKKAAPKKK